MDKKISLNNFFEVQDLSVSSFLYSLPNISLIGKRRLPDGKVVFLFSPQEEVQELVSKYWQLQAPPIQPKQLFSAQRDLKDLIFSG